MIHNHIIMSLLLMPYLCVSAQIHISANHKPNYKDSLLTYKMHGVAVGDSGRNCIWDFSALPIDSAYLIPVDYYALSKADTTRIGVHRERAHYYLLNSMDTLWMTGYETSYMHMQYSSPVPMLHFPFAYGDSIVNKINGKGQYCHHIPLSIEGRTIVRADGIGQIILPDITIDSVLRVHTEYEYIECVIRQTKVKEDRYQWYSSYCNYPILEVVEIQSVSHTDTTNIASTYYLPQRQTNTPICELKDLDNIDDKFNKTITNVTYTPNPVVSELQICYTLVRDSHVYISLHYNGGTTTFQTKPHEEHKGNHTTSINMNGLPIGNYVVYVHADDAIVAGNILKI